MKIQVTKQFYLVDTDKERTKANKITNLFGKIGEVKEKSEKGCLCEFGENLRALIPADACKKVYNS